MELTAGEIIGMVAVAVVLAAIVGGYMIYTRRKGLM